MRQVVDFNNESYSGFRLRYVPKKDVFQLDSGKYGSWQGSLKTIWQKMHWDFGIANKEVRMALIEMDKNHHNVADFGIFGTFICTFED